MPKITFHFWHKYLQYLSLFFAFLGLMWALIGSFDPLGIYDTWMAQTFYGQDELPPDVARATSFILAPFGATAMGYFMLQYYIVRYAFPSREKWAFNAVFGAFFAWFCLDTAMCIYHSAYFNIILANISSLSLTLPAFFGVKRYFKG